MIVPSGAGPTMPAVVFERPGTVLLAERPVPVADGAHDVLVQVVATGICGTDRGIALGQFPAAPGVILGHEAVGLVAAAGASVTTVRVGDPVVVNPTFYCGHCRYCHAGREAYCREKDGREIGVDADGSMAPFLAIDARFVHALPPAMTVERAVLIEPLACVLNNLAAAGASGNDRVLVVGAGPVGALCALTLVIRGAQVTILDRDPTRVDMARRLLPPTPRLLAVAGQLGDLAEDRSPPPDVVIDTTGVVLEEALTLVDEGGTVVVMGEREPATATISLRSLVTRGIRVVGAGPYAPGHFLRALELANEMPLESLVSHRLPLADFAAGFRLLGVPAIAEPPAVGGYQAMKVLLVDEGATF